jgi:hypothetical protein
MAADDFGVFFDDIDNIANDTVLFRRIYPHFVQWDGIAQDAKPPLPSQGFQDYPAQKAREEFNLPGACMSVAVEHLLAGAGYNPEKMIEDYDGYGIAAITAGTMRSLQGPPGTNWAQGVMCNPTVEEPWHAVVFCTNGGKKTNGIQNAIVKHATWVIEPRRPASSAQVT